MKRTAITLVALLFSGHLDLVSASWGMPSFRGGGQKEEEKPKVEDRCDVKALQESLEKMNAAGQNRQPLKYKEELPIGKYLDDKNWIKNPVQSNSTEAKPKDSVCPDLALWRYVNCYNRFHNHQWYCDQGQFINAWPVGLRAQIDTLILVDHIYATVDEKVADVLKAAKDVYASAEKLKVIEKPEIKNVDIPPHYGKEVVTIKLTPIPDKYDLKVEGLTFEEIEGLLKDLVLPDEKNPARALAGNKIQDFNRKFLALYKTVSELNEAFGEALKDYKKRIGIEEYYQNKGEKVPDMDVLSGMAPLAKPPDKDAPQNLDSMWPVVVAVANMGGKDINDMADYGRVTPMDVFDWSDRNRLFMAHLDMKNLLTHVNTLLSKTDGENIAGALKNLAAAKEDEKKKAEAEKEDQKKAAMGKLAADLDGMMAKGGDFAQLQKFYDGKAGDEAWLKSEDGLQTKAALDAAKTGKGQVEERREGGKVVGYKYRFTYTTPEGKETTITKDLEKLEMKPEELPGVSDEVFKKILEGNRAGAVLEGIKKAGTDVTVDDTVETWKNEHPWTNVADTATGPYGKDDRYSKTMNNVSAEETQDVLDRKGAQEKYLERVKKAREKYKKELEGINKLREPARTEAQKEAQKNRDDEIAAAKKDYKAAIKNLGSSKMALEKFKKKRAGAEAETENTYKKAFKDQYSNAVRYVLDRDQKPLTGAVAAKKMGEQIEAKFKELKGKEDQYAGSYWKLVQEAAAVKPPKEDPDPMMFWVHLYDGKVKGAGTDKPIVEEKGEEEKYDPDSEVEKEEAPKK